MDYSKKVVILAQEDPSKRMFEDTCSNLGVKGIEPLDFINPESHVLVNLYKEVFRDEVANQLLGYLVHKHDKLLVWDIINAIYECPNGVVVVNATLLTESDMDFLVHTLEHPLTYTLEESAVQSARIIYEGVKNYKDEVGL